LTKANHLGDIIFGSGLDGGGIAFAIQEEPWFQASGSCGFAKVKNNGKPSLMQKLSR